MFRKLFQRLNVGAKARAAAVAAADDKRIFIGMLAGGVCSLVASFVLSVEALQLAKNPDAILSCSINIFLNCATVARHSSAELLGFPNSFLGLIAESVVITVAVAGLMGVRFPRAFMFAAQIGYTIGLGFALWLFYTSMFVIQALCPWCLLVTLTTLLVWFSLTRYNVRYDNLYLPAGIAEVLKRWTAKGYDMLLLAGLIVGALALIIVKYGAELFA